MEQIVLFPVGASESCRFACEYLKDTCISLTDHPSPDVTHLLLDVPTKAPSNSSLHELLRMLPKAVTIIGGNLKQDIFDTYKVWDLLKDPHYLAMNAAITAECALQAAAAHLNTIFRDSPALILGWGRIGKCLSKLLTGLGCPVTIAARKESDRAMAEALGYQALEISQVPLLLYQHRILFNTVPGITLPEHPSQKDCIKIDLASLPGLQDCEAISARGLPGKYAPRSSGKLIAETILRLIQEESL